MNKKIFGIALVALSVVTFSVAAKSADSETGSKKKEHTECGKTKCDKSLKGDKKGERKEINPFEGLNLTDSQKAQLTQLKEKQREARKTDKNKKDADRNANRQARMEARKEAKLKYLAEVKSIIGADQYVKFLENSYINGGGKFAKSADKRHKPNFKGERKGGKSHRTDSKHEA